MGNEAYTRRTLLRRSVATVGVGVAVGAAGCSSIPNPFGGKTGSYTEWLPAPDDLYDTDSYFFDYTDMEGTEQAEDTLGNSAGYEGAWAPVDLAWDDTSAVISVDSVTVVPAEFDRNSVVSDLEDEGFEEDTDHQGYTLYSDEEDTRAFGVGDGTLIANEPPFGEEDATDGVEAVLDAKKGDGERYTEASEDCQTLVDKLGTATFVGGGTVTEPDEPVPGYGRFENVVAEGDVSTIDGDTVEREWYFLYESEGDVDTDPLETYVGNSTDNDREFGDVDDVSYSQDGRFGVITGTTPTSNYYG